jgi:proline dehydrogenase
VRRLNDEGCEATIDLLGESIRSQEEASRSADTYLEVLAAIERERLRANVSVKPTHFGLAIDRASFLGRLRGVVARAREHGNFVRVDMEESPWTQATLDAYRALRGEGFDNLGVVVQACLRRTPADLRALADLGPSLRLCKGVYREPESIAWTHPEDIRRAWRELLRETLPDARYRVAMATHDDALVEEGEDLVRRHRLGRERYEFQMLLGVKPELRRELVARGHTVRIYVPFGKDWYAYSIRRLRENPKFAGYITLDVLKDPARLLGRDGASR